MTYPAGVETYFNAEYKMEKERIAYNLLIEREMQDTYEDAVSKFYSPDFSYKTAKAMATLWAQAFKESEWHDEAVCDVAEKLGLDWKECYAILGDQDNLRKIIEDEMFWKMSRLDLNV